MQPETDVNEDRGCNQRGDAFGDLAARTTDLYQVVGNPPGHDAEHHGADPADMDVLHGLATPGLDQGRHDGCKHEYGLDTLAQQDNESTEKRSLGGHTRRAQGCLGFIEQGDQALMQRFEFRDVTALRGLAEADHFFLDCELELLVNNHQGGLGKLEAIEIG